jgi:hypothetical protein
MPGCGTLGEGCCAMAVLAVARIAAEIAKDFNW